MAHINPNVFHQSARAASSTNVDGETGQPERRLITSTIEMFWLEGALVIRGKSSVIKLPGAALARRVIGTARGGR